MQRTIKTSATDLERDLETANRRYDKLFRHVAELEGWLMACLLRLPADDSYRLQAGRALNACVGCGEQCGVFREQAIVVLCDDCEVAYKAEQRERARSNRRHEDPEGA
jgi:hypothetical protein